MKMQVLSQRFCELKKIAESDFSSVYRGRDTVGRHVVALKVSTASRGFPRETLIREFDFLSRLRHPNIVRVYDFGMTASNCPFFAMEWVRGMAFLAAMNKYGPPVVLDAIPSLCRALAEVHESGYVYGDLSPSNILLTRTRDETRTTLVDFGMAAKIGTSHSRELWGTPDFMPPEVHRGDPLTPASDVHSFGNLLKQVIGNVGRSASVIPGFNLTGLGDLVHACLAEYPELRPQGFREIEDIWWENIAGHNTRIHPTGPAKKTGTGAYGLEPYLRKLREYCGELLDRGGGIVFIGGSDGVGKSTLVNQHRRTVQMQGHATLRLICDRPGKNAEAIRAAMDIWSAETKEPNKSNSRNRRALFVYLESDREVTVQAIDLAWLLNAVKGMRTTCIVESPPPPQWAMSPDLRTITVEPLSRDIFGKACEAVFADVPFISSLVSFLYTATGGIPGSLLAKKFEYSAFIRQHCVPDRFNWRRSPEALAADIARSIRTMPPVGKKVARSCTSFRAPFSVEDIAGVTGISADASEKWLGVLAEMGILKTVANNRRTLYDTRSLWVDCALKNLRNGNTAQAAGHVGEEVGRAASAMDQRTFRRFLTSPAVVGGGNLQATDYQDFRCFPEAITVCRNICRRKGQWANVPDAGRRAVFFAVASNYEAAGDLARARKWVWRMANQELVSSPNRTQPKHTGVVEIIRLLDRYGTPDQKTAWIRAFSEASSDLDEYVIALLTSERGAVDLTRNDPEAALRKFYEAEARYSRIGVCSNERVRNLSRIGVVNQLRKNYDRAMEYFARADRMRGECPDADLETGIMIKLNAGTVLLERGFVREALQHFQAAKSVVKQTHNLKLQAYLNRNMVLCVADLEPASAAVRAAHEALVSSRKARLSTAEPSCLSNLGWTYLRAGDVLEAKKCLQRAIDLAMKTDNLRVLSAAYVNLAELYRLQGAYLTSVAYAARSFRTAERFRSPQAQAEALRELSLTLIAAGKPDTAGKWLDRATHAYAHQTDLSSRFFADLIATEIDLGRGELESAAKRIKAWDDMGPEKMLPGWVCALGRLRGRLQMQLRNPESAIREFRNSALLARRLERYDLLLPVYEALVDAYVKTARARAALPMIAELGRLYQKVGHMREKSKLDEAIRELAQVPESTQMADMIFQLSQSLTRFSEKRPLLDHLLGLAVEYFGADRGALVSRHPISRRLFMETHRGLDSALDQNDALKISRTVVRKVSQAGMAVKVDDAQHDPLTRTKKSIIQQNIQSVLCVPVLARGSVWGALYLDNRSVPEAFRYADVKVLQSLANFMALALEQSDEFVRLKFQTERETTQRASGFPFIALSQKMRSLLTTVDKVADSAATILILGENGTGKDMLARNIHERSARRSQPFITMNCAGLVETLAESELFGIEDNVATGVKFREGKFKLADGGTLFLNEIGDLSLAIQAKSLQALQDRIIERVGGIPIGVDVRFIAATNKDLKSMITSGQFREDLYYRISSITLTLPSLRERIEDVPHLARSFLDYFCREYGRANLELDEKNLDEFIAYDWPGNVRELKGVIERGVLLSDGDRFPLGLTGSGSTVYGRRYRSGTGLQRTLEDTERQCILEALVAMGWNQSKAAHRLGLSESTLRSKMGKLRIKKPRAA